MSITDECGTALEILSDGVGCIKQDAIKRAQSWTNSIICWNVSYLWFSDIKMKLLMNIGRPLTKFQTEISVQQQRKNDWVCSPCYKKHPKQTKQKVWLILFIPLHWFHFSLWMTKKKAIGLLMTKWHYSFKLQHELPQHTLLQRTTNNRTSS